MWWGAGAGTPARGFLRKAGDILGCNPKKAAPRDEKIHQAVGGKVSNDTNWLLSVGVFPT